MNNGICPECGCEMLVWDDREIEIDEYGSTVVEVTIFCPSCGTEETYYED